MANAFETAQGKVPPEASGAATPPEPAVALVADVDDVLDVLDVLDELSPIEPLPADGMTFEEELPAALEAAVG